MLEPPLSDALFRLLRFLGHELARPLEHVDLRLEGFDELQGDEREVAAEVALALLEGIEFDRGYLFDPLSVLGAFEIDLVRLPTPAGDRTIAAVSFSPASGMSRPLGLPPRARLLFDGVHAYLEIGGRARLWAEVTAEGPRAPAGSRLPIVE